MKQLELFNKLSALETEQINPNTTEIDIISIEETIRLINNEDKKVAFEIEKVIPEIALAVETIKNAFSAGGRLFYFGAGTSGRLGILDAAECPPTFGTSPEMVVGIIAGGKEAVFVAQEGAEDKPENGATDVEKHNVCEKDVVCGIAASGRTPYVVGALKKAKEIGCRTILVSTVSKETAINNGAIADIMICVPVGPEVIAGSTRMKSGTAQKMILNMLTTASMVHIGKTYGNIMIDLKPTNIKLQERAKRIVMKLTGVDYNVAEEFLLTTNWSVKHTLLMILGEITFEEADKLLKNSNGKVRLALEKVLQK
ncbi:MAG: N-acetylmuramic acid 6-phosphate etherase [Bacteroidota bacterium]